MSARDVARRVEPTGSPELDPLPARPELVLRSFAYWMAQYRRTWRGSAITTVLEPLGFLAAMGFGLGLLVDRGSGSATLGGVGYLEFIAPGLLAATSMQTATFESTYPVMGSIKWHRTYHGMLATPLRTVDTLAGHLLFVAFRLTVTATAFFLVMLLFGAIPSVWGVLAVPAAVLTGLAFAPAIFAFSATVEDQSAYAMLFRFGIMPMFLFSGTFFPISQLPGWLEPAALVVPLWHGVDLARDLALGQPSPGSAAVHVGYLLLWAVGGIILAAWRFEKRLVE
jgi:lipooligosaccharide transport system permease protein